MRINGFGDVGHAQGEGPGLEQTKQNGLGLAAACLVMLAAAVTPTMAQSERGMAAEQYFVGSWACKATTLGSIPIFDIAITFTMEAGLLRELDEVRIAGMAAPYTIHKSI